jgi:Na+/proline symporter
MQTLLGAAIIAYLAGLFAIAVWAQGRIHNEEDYIVAGRRLPFSLSTATLLATWFGAGTLLTATDKIRESGLRVTALEPYGAGLCLLIAGSFFAKPLWNMKLCTLSDLYRRRFGRKAELLSVFVTVPGYIGWVAVQLVALAGIVELVFGTPMAAGIPLIAFIAMAYTLLGGMWSVTITDAVQLVLLVAGVLLLGYETFASLGAGSWSAGLARTIAQTPPEHLVIIPHEDLGQFFGWMSVLAVAALGNLTGQDLTQRIFSAKSAGMAKNACLAAGVLYIALGTVPVLIGLAAKAALPEAVRGSVLTALAMKLLSPALIVVFVLALISVVLSTIDSAILAPAATLSRNALRTLVPARFSSVQLCQFCVVLITTCSTVLALWGKDAYAMLEESYAIGLVGLFVPFVIGVFGRVFKESAAILAMLAGTLVWASKFIWDAPQAVDLAAVLASFVAYFSHARWGGRVDAACAPYWDAFVRRFSRKEDQMLLPLP